MNTKTYCIHQICRPSTDTRVGMNEGGRGDCFVCTPDEDNKNCSHYKMVVMGLMEDIEKKYF